MQPRSLTRFIALAPLGVAASAFEVAHADQISPAGQQLAQKLDSFEVEKHWPAHLHVNWETGVPDGKPEKGIGVHTHCSAFVASAAKQLGV